MFRPPVPSNFDHLAAYDEQLLRLGMQAERYNHEDPNAANLKLRQLTATDTTARVGLYAHRPKGEGKRPTSNR